ncbi:hypothetical protein [Dactylosporangium sp. CA-092794]|uniref:hypothetical protein n=1 Tax=Dactylosporangium sp. CA-092794 TaxID=3239929 RepID=UPI003D9375C9
MNASLPPIDAQVLVAAVEALPARLRKKLDDTAAKLADRPVTRDGDRTTVTIDDATTVTLLASADAVRDAESVTCTCLLAPNCLHRAAVLSLAPVWDPASAPAPADPAPAPSDDGPGAPAGGGAESAVDERVDDVGPVEGAAELTVQQRAAVEQLWRAAAAVLADGVTGSGTVARAALLRAAHEAQACRVYRPAAAARIVAALLQAGRAGDAHYRLGDLADALRELLDVTHRLHTGQAGAFGQGLLGSARRQYHLEGSLRLYGLFTTAVLAGTGHAGVVTYAADRRGRLWMVADVMPGDARRAARAGNATVAMGETALTHRGLTRAGLVVSGATASDSRQLGAGRAVRAVTASGASWHEEPLAGLWAEPVADQVHRAFAALAVPVTDRPAGDDLLFLRLTIRGTDGDAVVAEEAGGMPLTLRVAAEHPALGYRDNLRVLGRAAGLELLLIARPDPGRPGTVLPLAVAPPEAGGWHLPAPYDGHADLAFDRLHGSQFPQSPALPGLPPVAAPDDAPLTPPNADPDPGTDPNAGNDAEGTRDSTDGNGDEGNAGEGNGGGDDGGSSDGNAGSDGSGDGDDGNDREADGSGDGNGGGDGNGDGDGDGNGDGNDRDGDGSNGGGDDGSGDGGDGGGGSGVHGDGDGGGWRPVVSDPALHLLRTQVERTVAGGRAMLTMPGGRGSADAARLRRARLETGAALLDRLASAAADRPRDAFGRLADDDGTAFARAWLGAAAYADAAGRAFAEASWLPGDPHLGAG